jgi:hypothetical protein
VPLHLIKLCVGCDTVEELLKWRREMFSPDDRWILRTKQMPKRSMELIDGGSLYRVYKGFILSRQRILEIDAVGVGGARHCEMRLDTDVILTVPAPRRAFQGWRYLNGNEAPPDLAAPDQVNVVPPELARQLRELGAW